MLWKSNAIDGCQDHHIRKTIPTLEARDYEDPFEGQHSDVEEKDFAELSEHVAKHLAQYAGNVVVYKSSSVASITMHD